MNGEIYPSLFLLSMGFSFPFRERKLHQPKNVKKCWTDHYVKCWGKISTRGKWIYFPLVSIPARGKWLFPPCWQQGGNDLFLMWRELGMGFSRHEWRSHECGKKISPWVTKGTFPFPHEWLSRNSEKWFPHERRSREWGNSFLLWLLSHEWGNGNVPFVTNGEIYPSLILSTWEITFPCGEENLSTCTKWKILLHFYIFKYVYTCPTLQIYALQP